MMFALPAILDQQGIQDLVNPRYCQQDTTGFYTIDANINLLPDLVNYCPQDTGVYEFVVSGSPTVPSIMTTDTALWLDANDATILTLDGSSVTEWRDKSGNNRHASQATASNRPLLVANGLNGTDVIRFDGSNDWFSIANSPSDLNSLTVFTIWQSSVANGRIIDQRGTGGVPGTIGWQFKNFNPTGDMIAVDANTSFLVYSNYTAVSGFNLTGFSFQDGSNTLYFYAQGVVFSVTGSTVTGIANTKTIHIGTNLNGQNTQFFNGDISQIIIFPRVLTQAERELVEGYLAWSVRLEGNLPSNHPYKNSYPGITVTSTLVGNIYDFDQTP